MRLLLGFLLLASNARAASYICGSRVIDFYNFEQTTSPSCGPDSVTLVGAFSYTTSGATVDNYAVAPTVRGSGATITFPSNVIDTSTWTAEWTSKTGSDVTSNQVELWGRGNGAASSRVVEAHVLAAAHFYFVNGANACVGVTPAVSANTEYYRAISADATSTRFYVATVTNDVIGPIVLACTGAALTWGNKEGVTMLNSFNALDKWMGDGIDRVIFSNVALTQAQLPTRPMVNAMRNPYLRRGLSPKLGSWLPLLFFTPSNLPAITQSQVSESKQVKASSESAALKVVEQKWQYAVNDKTVVTATATRTPVGVTPTLTPDPAK